MATTMERPTAAGMNTLVRADAISKVIGSNGTRTTILEGISFAVPSRSLGRGIGGEPARRHPTQALAGSPGIL